MEKTCSKIKICLEIVNMMSQHVSGVIVCSDMIVVRECLPLGMSNSAKWSSCLRETVRDRNNLRKNPFK